MSVCSSEANLKLTQRLGLSEDLDLGTINKQVVDETVNPKVCDPGKCGSEEEQGPKKDSWGVTLGSGITILREELGIHGGGPRLGHDGPGTPRPRVFTAPALPHKKQLQDGKREVRGVL